MRKTAIFSLIFLLGVIGFVACGKKAEAPKAGSASADDMLSLLPMNAKGVFLVNVNQAMAIETAEKAIKESDHYQKYLEFVEKTGVDPQKDIYYVAAAMISGFGDEEEKGVAIVNMKYDKEKILPLIKEKMAEEGEELIETEYSGLMIYKVEKVAAEEEVEEEEEEEQQQQQEKEEKGLEEGAFAFLDSSNIVVGNEDGVKSVIDISQKKADNIYKNQALADLLAKTNKEGILWGAILIPSEAVEKAASENPMMSSFEAVKAATLLFDYKNQNVLAEIKLMSDNEENNKKIADALNGFKAIGGMAAAQKPELGELLNKIEISSTADHVKIYCSLPEELLNKLKSAIPEDID
ncbi:MAG: hypothetical protein WBF32_00130 [Candidatus Aminicenantaceae bacterium]